MLICSNKPEIHVPDPERNFGDRFPVVCKIWPINPDKIYICKQNINHLQQADNDRRFLYEVEVVWLIYQTALFQDHKQIKKKQ